MLTSHQDSNHKATATRRSARYRRRPRSPRLNERGVGSVPGVLTLCCYTLHQVYQTFCARAKLLTNGFQIINKYEIISKYVE